MWKAQGVSQACRLGRPEQVCHHCFLEIADGSADNQLAV